MEFNSLIFLFIFLPCFLLSYFLIKNRKWKNIILFLFSLLFYAWGEPIYVILMIFSIVLNYFLAKLIVKNYSKSIFIFSIVINIGILFIFKYSNFFIENINNLFKLNIDLVSISLPIGISFYTFQILSYLIDVYLKKVEYQKSILLLGCYISSFPQLVAGPIVRYDQINCELISRKENINDFAFGIERFILGLAKKVLIANQMGYICDSIFSFDPIQYGFVGAFVGIVSYTFQIYFDFSGYSDMAIGLGRMLGFHYDENFNYPYIATSITDFWKRWHISLSQFFRDYVYIPLGGNRVTKIINIRNIFVVWLLTGIWHGASWNFIIWGVYYGILLIIEKFILKGIIDKFPNWLKHFYTMFLVAIGWGIFYCTNIDLLKGVFFSLVFKNGIGNLNVFVITQILTVKNIISFLLAILFSMPIYLKFREKNHEKWYFPFVLIFVFLICILNILRGSYNPFIYFNF